MYHYVPVTLIWFHMWYDIWHTSFIHFYSWCTCLSMLLRWFLSGLVEMSKENAAHDRIPCNISFIHVVFILYILRCLNLFVASVVILGCKTTSFKQNINKTSTKHTCCAMEPTNFRPRFSDHRFLTPWSDPRAASQRAACGLFAAAATAAMVFEWPKRQQPGLCFFGLQGPWGLTQVYGTPKCDAR